MRDTRSTSAALGRRPVMRVLDPGVASCGRFVGMDVPMTSAASVPGEGWSVIEVRVHGIGDHAEWSSLGGPTRGGMTAMGTLSSAPEVSGPPRRAFQLVPSHPASIPGAVILAFPYTLMNMAYQMTPAGRGSEAPHGAQGPGPLGLDRAHLVCCGTTTTRGTDPALLAPRQRHGHVVRVRPTSAP